MGKHKQDYDYEGSDSYIPLSVIDASVAKIIRCEDTETHDVLVCLIRYRIDKYFKDCLKATKRGKKKRRKCDFEPRYHVVGSDWMDDNEESGEESGEEEEGLDMDDGHDNEVVEWES